MIHRGVGSVAFASGLCVLGAYLLGSIPLGYLLTRRKLRWDLRRLDRRGGRTEAELRDILTGRAGVAEPLPGGLDVAGAVLDTAKVILLALSASLIVRHVGPGFHRGDVPSDSAIGFLADQVLTAWQSAALWAGLAAAVGHLCPIYLGFRAGQGQAPALGLAMYYVPFGFSVTVAAFLVGLVLTRQARRAVLVSLPAFVAYGWLAWIYDLPHSWGALPGPELALWCAVLAGVVTARTLSRPSLMPGAP